LLPPLLDWHISVQRIATDPKLPRQRSLRVPLVDSSPQLGHTLNCQRGLSAGVLPFPPGDRNSLLAESLEVIQRTSALILAAIEPPAAEQTEAAPVMAEAI